MLNNFLKLPPAFQLNIIFFIGMAITVCVFSDRINSWINFFVIYLSMALFQFFLYKAGDNSIISAIRNVIFPVFSVLISFDTVGELTPLINPGDIDGILLELDYLILGFYPYLTFEKISYPLLTEVMQIAYCVYYILPFVIGFYLISKKDIVYFHKALFLILFCYYLSYIGYMLFPALGPRYSIAQLFQYELKGIFLAEDIKNLLNSLEGIKRDAFPSGHVGISLLVLYMMWLKNKRMFFIFFIPVILLVISTVYCRYHYFVDVIGGVILTVVTLVFGNLYYNFWLKKNGNSSFKG